MQPGPALPMRSTPVSGRFARIGTCRSTRFLILAGIVVLGLGLRAAAVSPRSIWFDEAFTWRIAQFPIGELVRRTAADNSPPLHFLLLRGWMGAFGDSLPAMRGLSVLFGGLTIVGVYLVCMEGYGKEQWGVASLAALLVALSFVQIRWSAEVRMYSLGTALCAFSSWSLLRAVRKSDRGISAWLTYGVLALAFLYTHYFALFTLFAHAVFLAGLAAVQFWKRPVERRNAWKIVWKGACAGAVVVVGFAPWMPAFLAQQEKARSAFWTQPIEARDVPTVCYHLFLEPPVYERPGRPPDLALGIALTALCAGSLLVLWRRPRPADIFVFISATAPFLICMLLSVLGTHLFFYRYFLFAHLFLLVAVARAVARLPDVARPAGGAWLIANFAVLLAISWQKMDYANRPGMRAAIQSIREQSTSDPVIACSAMFYLPALYHGRDDLLVRLYGDGTQSAAHYEGITSLVPADLIRAEQLPDFGQRLWMINGHDCPLPRTWRAESSVRFPEASIYQGAVVVTEFRSGE